MLYMKSLSMMDVDEMAMNASYDLSVDAMKADPLRFYEESTILTSRVDAKMTGMMDGMQAHDGARLDATTCDVTTAVTMHTYMATKQKAANLASPCEDSKSWYKAGSPSKTCEFAFKKSRADDDSMENSDGSQTLMPHFSPASMAVPLCSARLSRRSPQGSKLSQTTAHPAGGFTRNPPPAMGSQKAGSPSKVCARGKAVPPPFSGAAR